MDVRAHQIRQCRIHQLMPLHARATRELVRHHDDGEMPAFAGTGMAGVSGAVIVDLERYRREARGKHLADFRDALGGAHVEGSACRCRASHATCRPANMTVAAVRPNSLKFTQVRSLALKATNRLRPPSSA